MYLILFVFFKFWCLAVSVEDPKHSKGSIALYGVAGFLNGAGYAPFYPLGLVYIDQNVQNDHESSKYLGMDKEKQLWCVM